MNETVVTLTVRSVARDGPAPTRTEVYDLVTWLLDDETTLTLEDVVPCDSLRLVVALSEAAEERDALAAELRQLEDQLAAAQEYQLELQAKLDLQTEEARRAVERAYLAERRKSGEHVGYDC